MGIYDCFGIKNIQLKVGKCTLKNYNIGDKVEIPDGVYVGYGGVIVIKNQTFFTEFDNLIDKWGGKISPREIL